MPTFLADRAVPLAWEDRPVCLPKVGVTKRTLTADRWQRRPKGLSTLLAPVTKLHAHNLTCTTVQRQPAPLFVAFVADKRPGFGAFQGQAPLVLALTMTGRGTCS
jgi:hypothetical protein